MFRVDRFTKWRTRSISPTSGNGGDPSASADAGNSAFTGSLGTSHAGKVCARRPGRLISKSSAVDWSLSTTRSGFHGCFRLGGHVQRERGRQAVDLGPCTFLGDGNAEAVVQLGIPAAQVEPGMEARFEQYVEQ